MKKPITIGLLSILSFSGIIAEEIKENSQLLINTIQLFDQNNNNKLENQEIINARKTLNFIDNKKIILELRPVSKESSTVKNSIPKTVNIEEKNYIKSLQNMEEFLKEKDKAYKNDKNMVIILSSESWNQPSKDFAKNVYNTEEFQKYAKENPVFLIKEDRMKKSEIIKEIKKEYKLFDSPTILIFRKNYAVEIITEQEIRSNKISLEEYIEIFKKESYHPKNKIENKIKFIKVSYENGQKIESNLKINEFLESDTDDSYIYFSYESEKEIKLKFFHGGMRDWSVEYSYQTIEGNNDYHKLESFEIDSVIITLPPSKEGNGDIIFRKDSTENTYIKLII